MAMLPPRMTAIPMPELKSQNLMTIIFCVKGQQGYSWQRQISLKSRNSPTKLSELRAIKDQLEDKFQYLFTAPDTDNEGNPTILR